MKFWVGWALWEKMTTVLAFSIALVLLYAFCALELRKWKTRRFEAAEARQREEDNELYPMLQQMDDIPFGIRALEREVRVEGIWFFEPNNNPFEIPDLPGESTESRPLSPASRPAYFLPSSSTSASSKTLEAVPPNRSSLPSYKPTIHLNADIVTASRYTYETQRPGAVYSPAMPSSPPDSPGRFQRRSDISTHSGNRASFHSRVYRTSHMFEKSPLASPHGHQDQEIEMDSMSATTSAPNLGEQHRASRITRLIRRRSSEEFRRRMSQIFNERIHMNVPTDQLQFSPQAPEKKRRFRQSILGTFRSEG
ncbi:hypothetical protein N7532_005894 [Penicillium argentinense]|uniref:Uncharacterized protein n=1 Tax=Penicillium argentinense TaxID=1131581 RepID=A0A9W9KAD2_9EURO|nr:uncharacterized protein N7532_005894 [Penicillium argentinense]KAJ5098893.1 hypothetical protein N7532_005894 [Penicillium argentinense]